MWEVGDRDIDLITRTILGEAAREPTQGKAGVAHVIMNRLKAGNYGKSIPDVLFAPKQFEPWGTRKTELLGYGPQTPGWQEAENIAKTVARGLAPDPTGGALNFLNRGYSAKRGDRAMQPGGWGNNMDNPIQIGAHTFGTAAGAGTGREGRVRVASADPNFVPGGAPAAPAAAASPTMPMGGLGGLGGYQPPTGMQTFGDILSALGMSLLSSPSNNMFQALPQTYTAIQGRRGKEADRAREEERWATEFGLKKQDIEARRAEQAIDNARQERALAIQEQNAKRSGNSAAYNTTVAMFPNLTPGSPEFMAKYKEVAQGAESPESYGAVTYETRPDGSVVAVQAGNRGGLKERKVEGAVGKTPLKVETPTETILLDPVTREELKRLPKDVAGAASARKQGEAQGELIAGAPNAYETAKRTATLINEAILHPGRELATGRTALLNPLTEQLSTDVAGFQSRIDQMKGAAFLEAFKNLKGGGAISEKEGEKAEAAIARLKRQNVSEEEYLQAMKDLRDVAQAGMLKAEQLMKRGGMPGAPKAPPPGFNSSVPGANRRRYDANGNPI